MSVHSPEDIHVHQSREIGKHFLIFVRADTVVELDVQDWRKLSPVAVVVDSSLNRAMKTRNHEITVTHEPGVEEAVVRIRSAVIYNPEDLARETKTFITLRCADWVGIKGGPGTHFVNN